MDKKNTIFGVVLLIAAFLALRFAQPPAPAPKPAPPAAAALVTTGAKPTTGPSAVAPVVREPAVIKAAPPAEPTIVTLANDYLELRLTNFGGAIRDAALKKFPAERGKPEPVVFNAKHTEPMLGFVDVPGLGRDAVYELVSQTSTAVVYRAVANNIEVTRTYTLSPNDGKDTDPYQLKHETTFRNLGDVAAPLPPIALAIGAADPANAYDFGRYTTTGYSNDGKANFIMRAQLDSSRGFFGLGLGAHDARPPVTTTATAQWVTVKNQFFAAILTSVEQPATGVVTSRLRLRDARPDEDPNSVYAISAAANFTLRPIEPHGSTTLKTKFYVGPKEYRRLSNAEVFKERQDKVMDFGVFKFFSALLSTVMTWMQSFTHNWGLAIIATTLTLKILTLPLTLKAARSMKRMQKLAPEMKVIREKYKDNPQKQNAAMMDLYKEHGVNPLGGCIPMLIPMPFFFGFYAMLQGSSELRFAPFLWAHDLSMPDTVGHLLGYPINILPLLLAVTTIVQMSLTPQVNLDKTQAMMMKFTPIIFLIICYNFSCALALYSTVNGLFTIGQQVFINRMKNDGDPANAPKPGGKQIKNVTPKKR